MTYTSKNAGFSPILAVLGIAILGVLALVFFYPGGISGVASYFDKSGVASVSSAFGDFEQSIEDGGNVTIDDVAQTIVRDLMSIQQIAKSELEGIKSGVCFKNPSSAASADFYNIITNVPRDGNACNYDTGGIVKAIVTLPEGFAFTDPTDSKLAYIDFKNDGVPNLKKPISIKISDGTEVRRITVKLDGEISSVALEPETIETRTVIVKETVPLVVTKNTGPSAEELAKIAAGIAGILSQLDNLEPNVARASNEDTTDDEEPSVPRDLTADAGDESISLSWRVPSRIGDSNISEYRIYRSTSSGGTRTLIAKVSRNDLTYIDEEVTNDKTYFYRVSAKNSSGEGPLTNSVSATPTNSTPFSSAPTAPRNVSASGGNGFNVIKWDKPASSGSSSIVEYRIFRSTYPNGWLTLVGTTSALSFTHNNLTNNNSTYYYRVSARNATTEGPMSSYVWSMPHN